MKEETIDTHSKALRINLDQRRYGTFAEIGAGQEVVRWFFRVGGAAGTIAKSMSAYDMAVSDAIYGQAIAMSAGSGSSRCSTMNSILTSAVREERGDTTAFFVFADTVSARTSRHQ